MTSKTTTCIGSYQLSDAFRAADFDETSLDVDVETAVEHRVDGAVEQCQRLDERIDGVGDDEPVLGPDVDHAQTDRHGGSTALPD